jgi:type II secretory ATPase GspE/PulE/Tfp pilus assembly ATPase PilB-like protein
MGVDPYLIAPTLIMAMAQRLVRRVIPEARHEVPMDESTREMINKQFKDLDPEHREKLQIPDRMYEVRPTTDSPTGLRGRIAILEMFQVDRDIQELILKNPVEPELYKLCRKKGMLTLREDALMKALKGDVLLQEVYTFN